MAKFTITNGYLLYKIFELLNFTILWYQYNQYNGVIENLEKNSWELAKPSLCMGWKHEEHVKILSNKEMAVRKLLQFLVRRLWNYGEDYLMHHLRLCCWNFGTPEHAQNMS
jgi:hypothetical protein